MALELGNDRHVLCHLRVQEQVWRSRDHQDVGYSTCDRQKGMFKGKVMFLYSAVSSPLNHSKCFTLVALPDRPVYSDSNSASPGSILARQQLHAKTQSLTFPPVSIARYSFIQLSHSTVTHVTFSLKIKFESCINSIITTVDL